jgi:ATP-dependent Zn protease
MATLKFFTRQKSKATINWKKIFKTIPVASTGNDKLMATAYHESGHALIDLVYGLTPETITIIPDKDNIGHAENIWKYHSDLDNYLFLKGIDWPNDKQIEYLVTSFIAGFISEAIYTGQYNWQGANDDFNQILDMFLSYGINDIPDLQPYFDKAFELINSHEKKLHKIANDLYQKKTLTKEYFKII